MSRNAIELTASTKDNKIKRLKRVLSKKNNETGVPTQMNNESAIESLRSLGVKVVFAESNGKYDIKFS